MAQTVLRAEELLSDRGRVTGVCEAAGARFAFLFGSVIDTTPGRAPRDVDVAVSFHDYDFWTYLELREQLSRALGISEDRLDLVVLDRVNPRIELEAVLTGVPMFVADPGALDEFAVDALFAYDDFLRFRRELHESLWKRIEGGLSVAGRQLNRDRVETYLSRMDEAVGRLTVLRKRFTSYEEFEADADTRELVVHHLRIALECVLDVCRHFLATKGVSLSELDTTNLIELAGDRGLLDVAFARKIRGMAGMRNAIVGVYWRLDYQAIYETVTQKLGDFDEFARQVKRYLASEDASALGPVKGLVHRG
ncbi:MAG: DUF86 domain-containing protein [Bacillota bacterium]|nr:DUF86 domain-containing protein [Bacillota bacterium]